MTFCKVYNIYIYIYINKVSSIILQIKTLIPYSIRFCCLHNFPQWKFITEFDVKALYPSVPRKEARTACEKALQGRTNKSLTTECVLDMLDLALENNNFSFNDKHYIQREGTAIGSHLGMNYACTFLGDWEKELLQKSEHLPAQYWRYVDDT